MTTITARAAYYYPATKAQKARGQTGVFELHAITNGHREIIARQGCADTRAARSYASTLGATPWNF